MILARTPSTAPFDFWTRGTLSPAALSPCMLIACLCASLACRSHVDVHRTSANRHEPDLGKPLDCGLIRACSLGVGGW
jgi:hypothetical protein